MSGREVRVLASAKKDLRQGFSFYERQAPGVGAYFVNTLFSEAMALQFTAGIHSKRGNFFSVKSKTYMRRGSRWIDCRQAARKGEPRGRERVAFPYWIYYTIRDLIVDVIIILDARQAPSKIHQREKREQEFFS